RSKVPDTILSRCQQLEFRPVAADLIRARLQEIAAAEGFRLASSAAAAIAGAADGSVRDALSLLDQLRAFSAGEVDDDAVAAILGVPPLQMTTGLVAALAEGRVRDGLGLIREQLAAGQDPAVLFQEIGRALRSLLYLALDPELDPTLSAAHRAALEPLAGRLGADALGRMLALWVAQEALLREAANRELALEVASLKLARWPTVRGLEAWLAASGPLPPPATGVAGPGAAGPGSPSPGGSASLVSRGAGRGAAAARPAPDAEAPPPAAAANLAAALTERAAADPGVALAARILGGEVVAVRADGDGS
ncbi:MAG: hypothetical protein MUE90_10685, partial [Thermoanaerobaculales bacterium]|nr:hypothetical protein [Thermoanaerobaculales bacterium]